MGAMSWRAAKSSMVSAVVGLPDGELETDRLAIISSVLAMSSGAGTALSTWRRP